MLEPSNFAVPTNVAVTVYGDFLATRAPAAMEHFDFNTACPETAVDVHATALPFEFVIVHVTVPRGSSRPATTVATVALKTTGLPAVSGFADSFRVSVVAAPCSRSR